MDERTESISRRAFVLMPFRDPYDAYYTDIFKPALVAAGYEVRRADDLFAPRPIMLDIQESILEADLLLCEMSGRNPNVFYELGLAHAIGKPAILVANTQEDIPFDLRHVRVILYDSTSEDWQTKLCDDIRAAAKAVEKSDIWPPPLVANERKKLRETSQGVARAAAVRDVLRLTADGVRNARDMGLTENEVQQVLKAMLDKL